jgi:nitroreductase
MAVCTREALLLEGTRRDELVPLDAVGFPSPEALGLLMRGRRSIRLYEEELVDRAIIEGLLEVARWAPSGKNVQPLRYTVVSGKERVKELAAHAIDYYRALLQSGSEMATFLGAGGLVKAWDLGQDMLLRGAPHLIVAHGARQNPVLVGSGTIALTQIELQATAQGLGGCWAGYLQIAAERHEPLRRAMGLPEADAAAGAMMLGKPKVRYRAIPPRKPLEVSWR